ncbi:beta-galactosidase [Microbacter margulisiae]|uniref:beta-galactosidase n=1 Tax=Microbacter margulisiae TaxID=1350067 RepID=A0A7W5DUP3_9PORP|nr:beta-galactosidase [Microbacter margulisiae]MBB3188533.1 beta-galactosidase [Microbacter margulisiae]
MQKIFHLTLVLLLIFSGSLAAQEKYNINKEDFFPLSVWYSGGKARAPMLSSISINSKEEWKQDLEQIKNLGFNSVKTWVEWSQCEPQDGVYHFENLKMILNLANEIGLKVIIQVYAEGAPEWVGKKFPNALFEAQNGYKIQPQIVPGYCVDNKGVRNVITNFYQEVAKIAIQYPSFYGWDLWSEPHMVQWGHPEWINNVQYGFNPATQERFRQWLKAKYGTLEELNKVWHRNFEKWEDVEAPRFSTILTYSDFIDWKDFIFQKMAGDLKLRYDAIRSIDKTHITSSHASPVSLFETPFDPEGPANDFLMAKQVDYYGLSQYPKHNQPGDWIPWRFMAAADFSYSANKSNGGYYVGELQAGFGTVGLNVGDPVTSEDEQIWVLSSLATGAKGIFSYAYYPMSSGYESGGYGLINLDGSITKRAVELGKLAKMINSRMNIFATATPVKAEIALLYNPLSQMVGGENRVGKQGGLTNSLIGYYRYLTDQNIPVEFIDLADLENGDLSQYKLIIMPYALMISKKAAEGLESFVEKGGYVMSEARLAWNDEHGNTSTVIPGLGLSKMFGVRESKVKSLPIVLMKVSDRANPSMANLKLNDTLKGSLFAESLELLKDNNSVRVLARLQDNTPVIVTSNYGKGHTMYVGSFLCLAGSTGSLWDQSTQHLTIQNPANQNTNKFIDGLVKWAKIQRPFNVIQGDKTENTLVVRLQNYPEGYLLYVLNQGKISARAKIQLFVKEKGTYLLEELMQHKKIKVATQNKTIEFSTSEISVKDGEIWQIEKVND